MSDSKKILAHLKMRGGWVTPEELESAWKFEDFEKALDEIKKNHLVDGMSTMFRINANGLKKLKEEQC